MGVAVARRRLGVVDQPRTCHGPAPVNLREALYREAWVAERRRAAQAREPDPRPDSRNAVSLQVEPQLVLILREALARARGIQAAFVYGPAAQGQERPHSDVDLMVIGDDPTYADCSGGLLDAENVLKRRIRVRFVSAADWKRKLARGGAFVTKLQAQPRIFIFRSADDLRW
jgi:predicted nucleotidyltransferase